MDGVNLAGAENYTLFFLVILGISLGFNAFSKMGRVKKALYCLAVFGVFFVVMAYRAPNVGSDTMSYIDMMIRAYAYPTCREAIRHSGAEYGFIAYIWWLANIFRTWRSLLVVTAAIVSVSVGRFVYKYAEIPGLFCCFFVGLMEFSLLLSAMRQSIAVSILLFAFDAIMHRRALLFLGLVWLASTFHNSAWIFLLVLPLAYSEQISERLVRNDRLVAVASVAVVIIGVFFPFLLDALIGLFPKYSYYSDTAVFDGIPRLATVLNIVVFTLLYLIPKPYLSSEQKNGLELATEPMEKRRWNVFSKMVIINIAILFVSFNATVLSRLTSCFDLFANAYFGNSWERIVSKERYMILVLALIGVYAYGLVIVLLKTPDWQLTFPLKLTFTQWI